MPAKITENLTTSAFELVRDQIGAILALELAGQSTISGDTDLLAKVYVERYTNVSVEEEAVIIVGVDKASLSGHTQKSYVTKPTYNIDVYGFSRQTSSDSGYYISSSKIQKIMGVCTKILQNPQYIRLGFESPKFVQNRGVQGYDFDLPQNPEDATHARMGRIRFDVDVYDEVTGMSSEQVGGIDTTIELKDTDKGLLITVNNS